MLLEILKKKLLERFTKNNCKKRNQKVFRAGKVIKRKGDKLYVKWKGYDSFFKSWIGNKRQCKLVNIFQNQNLQKEEFI